MSEPTPTRAPREERTGTEPIWTVPNVICVLRILGTGPLVWAAWEGRAEWVLWIMVLLLASDWLDGKLAILLEQETDVGAVFDTVADALMYLAIGLSFWWLEGDVIVREAEWFAAVGVSWLASAAVALVRFGRMPSYHTWGAKLSWLVAAVVALLWLAAGWSSGVPWVLGLVILTNLEAAAIGLTLPEWRTNVPTLWHALDARQGQRDTTEST